MIFDSIFSDTSLTLQTALICSASSLLIGVVFGLIYRFTSKTRSKSLIFSLIFLPLAVQTVIIAVNGNIGAGIAVAGAFALVRFRSVPASAKEITLMFSDMALGLLVGSGYVTLAFLMLAVFALLYIALSFLPLTREADRVKKLKVTVPENLDYTTVFDDVFPLYARKNKLVKVKTSGLGTLYELTYEIEVKDAIDEKKLIDEIRLRNGNLPVMCTFQELDREEF